MDPSGLRSFLRRLGEARRSPAVWISFGLAAALVLVAVPRRQEASRIVTEARIPMRALTPPEAAALLVGGRARLARIGVGSVDLVTRDYLVPLVPGDPPAKDVLTRGSRSWRPVAASWNGYSLRHRLARGALERELAGRPLAEFHDPAAAAEPISFDSRRLALYAAGEVAVLWATFLLAWTIVRRVRPLHLVTPAFLLLAVGYLATVAWYSPAFFDADLFYQRWVVEEGSAYLAPMGAVLVPAAALSLFGLLAVGLLRLARRGRPPGPRQHIAASWAPAVLLVLAGAGVHGLAWIKDTRTLDALTTALNLEGTAWLAEARALRGRVEIHQRLTTGQLPPRLRAMAERALAVHPETGGPGNADACVLLGIGSGEYLFLWRSPSFTYLDFRTLDAQIDGDRIRSMLAARRPVAAGSLRDRFTGTPVLRPDGTVAALAYVQRTMPWWAAALF